MFSKKSEIQKIDGGDDHDDATAKMKWKTQKLEPNIGDIVLQCEDGQTRSNWPMGRILELYPSSDGMKRSALVKTVAGTLVRSIRKLQLIEPPATYCETCAWARE
ncbi:hypothetical protein T03_7720 [Trichinella britovi]|uniref:DUF5641 domain-containing protein n=1 Tax=Trichinella britovi TaxID=45882 RepID=A0A0V1C4M3_TRIBR|nr:hypothetical protein T03_7720 [Trichinella britovi]